MPISSPISYVVGFDDFAFTHEHRGNVPVVGAVYAGERLQGILRTDIRRDGTNATRKLITCVQESKFASCLQLVFLQGIALGGFNVIDIHALHEALGLPVLIVARRAPNMESVKSALITHVRGGARKWALIEKAGPMEPTANVWVQRAGLTLEQADLVIRRFAVAGTIPEPLRTAHLIGSGISSGQSRGRT